MTASPSGAAAASAYAEARPDPPADLPPTAPIFIVGTPRSGTTLLATLLGAHSAIACGPETGFFLNVPRQRRRAAADPAWPGEAVRLITGLRRPTVDGTVIEHFGLSAETVAAHLAAAPPATSSLLEAITVPFMRAQGKRRWAEKSPTHLEHLAEIRRLWPDAAIVRIVRDPRAVALSQLGVPFGSSGAVGAAYAWAIDETTWWRFATTDRRAFLLRYEDLVAHPEATLRGLCASLGEVFEAGMLGPAASDSEGPPRTDMASPGEWFKDRARGPVDATRASAWRDGLSAADQAHVALVCAAGMRRHGYPGASDPRTVVRVHPWVRAVARAEEALGELVANGTVARPVTSAWRPGGERVVVIGAPGELAWAGRAAPADAGTAVRLRAVLRWTARLGRARLRRRPVLWFRVSLGRRPDRSRIERLGDLQLRLLGRQVDGEHLVEHLAR